jgi:hypothetical protein
MFLDRHHERNRFEVLCGTTVGSAVDTRMEEQSVAIALRIMLASACAAHKSPDRDGIVPDTGPSPLIKERIP